MQKYSGATLVEMIVVMGVMIILFGIVFSAFSSLLNVNAVNEVTLEITQDIRRAQRSAMMVERRSDDRWVYGVGIDFGNITDEDNPSYTVFKFCAPESRFDGSNVRHTSDVPFNNDFMHPAGGREFFGSVNLEDTCTGEPATIGANHIPNRENKREISLEEYNNLNFEFSEGNNREIVFFQSVTGKAFMYTGATGPGWVWGWGSGGYLTGYDQGNLEEGDWNINEDDFEPLQIEIKSHDGVSERVINIYPVSGVIHVDNLLHRED